MHKTFIQNLAFNDHCTFGFSFKHETIKFVLYAYAIFIVLSLQLTMSLAYLASCAVQCDRYGFVLRRT